VGAFITLLAFPTLLTMFISGFWHGAGYLFLLWGLLHGVFLCINHAWRLVAQRWWKDKERYNRVMRPIGFVLTFTSVVFAMVLFRAPTLASAGHILKGMVGLNGIELPEIIHAHLGGLSAKLQAMHIGIAANWTPQDFIHMSELLPLLLIIAWFFPNTLQ